MTRNTKRPGISRPLFVSPRVQQCRSASGTYEAKRHVFTSSTPSPLRSVTEVTATPSVPVEFTMR
jgi:hypothetical protein